MSEDIDFEALSIFLPMSILSGLTATLYCVYKWKKRRVDQSLRVVVVEYPPSPYIGGLTIQGALLQESPQVSQG